VSSALAQFALADLAEYTTEQRLEMETNIKSAIGKMRSHQLRNGGFTYWPGSVSPSPWVTNYAGHFMLEAEGAGYALPVALKRDWLKFQKSESKRWAADPNNQTHHSQRTQAYRLLTLALA